MGQCVSGPAPEVVPCCAVCNKRGQQIWADMCKEERQRWRRREGLTVCHLCSKQWESIAQRFWQDRIRYDRLKEQMYPPVTSNVKPMRRVKENKQWERTPSFRASWRPSSSLRRLLSAIRIAQEADPAKHCGVQRKPTGFVPPTPGSGSVLAMPFAPEASVDVPPSSCCEPQQQWQQQQRRRQRQRQQHHHKGFSEWQQHGIILECPQKQQQEQQQEQQEQEQQQEQQEQGQHRQWQAVPPELAARLASLEEPPSWEMVSEASLGSQFSITLVPPPISTASAAVAAQEQAISGSSQSGGGGGSGGGPRDVMSQQQQEQHQHQHQHQQQLGDGCLAKGMACKAQAGEQPQGKAIQSSSEDASFAPTTP